MDAVTNWNPTEALQRPLNYSTVREVAARKRVSLSKLYMEISDGRLRVTKIGTRSLVSDQDEIAYDSLIRAESEAARNKANEAA